MRLGGAIPRQSHVGLNFDENNHHPEPTSVSINNTTQSLPPGTTYNLDITLPHADFEFARVMIMGPQVVPPVVSANYREYAEVAVTTVAAEAIAHSTRNAGTFKKVYAATYSKQNGDTYLSHKIFDSVTGVGNRYIQLLDAQIIGATLRLTFRNTHGGSAFLWVKGQALLW